ncbi:MAG TPA: TetR family transcriptional regulator [Pseudorhizobium sp.]|nr:TetR family transcriptional regulator [Pseudorhizobium sp.]
MTRDAEATKERLILAARRMFSERGFDGTTVREIAAHAEVNPALINRYFGGKEQLFAEAVSIDLALPDLSRTKREDIGATLAMHFFRRWEGDEHDDLLRVLIRTAATNPNAAARIQEVLGKQVTPMIASLSSHATASQRAYLVATQILGLAYTRYVIGMPTAEMEHERVVSVIGDTLQRYIVDPLP